MKSSLDQSGRGSLSATIAANPPGDPNEFVAALGHELRSPLNAVIGLSEALLEGGAPFDPERTARYLSLIQSSGRKHLAQLNDVIDIARHDCGRLKLDPQPFDLRQLCTSTFESARAENPGKSLFTKIQNFSRPLLLLGDERLLRRALHHLIARALKISPASSGVQLGTLRTENSAAIAISDSGEPLGGRTFESLFQPAGGEDLLQFGAVELGLALADRVIRLHEGHVTINPSTSGGSTLIVHFPARRLTE